MESPIAKILTLFFGSCRKKGEEYQKEIKKNLQKGMTEAQAVDAAKKAVGLDTWLRENVRNVIMQSAAIGCEVSEKDIPKDYAVHWDSDDMKLSERLHGASLEMRRAIVKTIKETQKKSLAAMDTARALYDGYGYGHVTNVQQIPKYLAKLVSFARQPDMDISDRRTLLSLTRKIQRQVDQLGKGGAPNQALKTSYKGVLKALDKANDHMLNKALKEAVEEKSRYVAERIARTEGARAWADGFYARYANDDEVVAFKWRLASRHPMEDICDMYAKADLWGLGPGIFPKDKCPALPLHPHCLCNLRPVYAAEIEGRAPHDQTDQAGREWLMKQSQYRRQKIMGIEGAKAFQNGGSWKDFARGYSEKTLTNSSALSINTSKNITGIDNVRAVNCICKIPKEHYSFITQDIDSDYVIITNERIQHIQKQHPGDLEKIKSFLKDTVLDPDFVSKSKTDENTALVFKEFYQEDVRLKLVLRLHTGNDKKGYQNSIITGQYVGKKRYKRYLNNSDVIYSKGKK